MNPIAYAKYELRRIGAQMGIAPEITLSVNVDAFDKTRFFRFDPQLDDAFTISVKSGIGSICATNERSVLMGVYHFLKLQGCRFFHPGKDGEYIPVTETVLDCEETWYAYTRHRGTEDYGCNGGIDGVLNVIDWLPKVMMNSFFIEHTSHVNSMNSWYTFRKDPVLRPQSVSTQQHIQWDEWINEECQKRGILRHGGGHGWTVMLMDGISELKSAPMIQYTNDNTACLNPEILPLLNGQRQLNDGVPLNTHVCLSQDVVRRAFVENVCKYSHEHPEINYLHIWLGDGYANFCECEACKKLSPTDWYVKLLNEIDAELTRRGSSQKLVFLAYFELLYPPTTERIRNEDRFTLLFCPYGRDFTKRYRDWEERWDGPKPFNQYSGADMRMDEYLAQLRRWKEIFHGDSLVFDYNLFAGVSFFDITNLNQNAIVADDCIFLQEIGLNGRIECGDTRFMTPSPITWNSMAQSLFYGTTLSEEEFFDDYFGKGQPVLDYFRTIRDAIPLKYMRRQLKRLTPEQILELTATRDGLLAFSAELFAHSPRNDVQRKHCADLQEYINLLELVINTVLEQHNGFGDAQTEKRVAEMREMAYRMNSVLPNTFSANGFFSHFRNMLQRTLTFD